MSLYILDLENLQIKIPREISEEYKESGNDSIIKEYIFISKPFGPDSVKYYPPFTKLVKTGKSLQLESLLAIIDDFIQLPDTSALKLLYEQGYQIDLSDYERATSMSNTFINYMEKETIDRINEHISEYWSTLKGKITKVTQRTDDNILDNYMDFSVIENINVQMLFIASYNIDIVKTFKNLSVSDTISIIILEQGNTKERMAKIFNPKIKVQKNTAEYLRKRYKRNELIIYTSIMNGSLLRINETQIMVTLTSKVPIDSKVGILGLVESELQKLFPQNLIFAEKAVTKYTAILYTKIHISRDEIVKNIDIFQEDFKYEDLKGSLVSSFLYTKDIELPRLTIEEDRYSNKSVIKLYNVKSKTQIDKILNDFFIIYDKLKLKGVERTKAVNQEVWLKKLREITGLTYNAKKCQKKRQPRIQNITNKYQDVPQESKLDYNGHVFVCIDEKDEGYIYPHVQFNDDGSPYVCCLKNPAKSVISTNNGYVLKSTKLTKTGRVLELPDFLIKDLELEDTYYHYGENNVFSLFSKITGTSEETLKDMLVQFIENNNVFVTINNKQTYYKYGTLERFVTAIVNESCEYTDIIEPLQELLDINVYLISVLPNTDTTGLRYSCLNKPVHNNNIVIVKQGVFYSCVISDITGKNLLLSNSDKIIKKINKKRKDCWLSSIEVPELIVPKSEINVQYINDFTESLYILTKKGIFLHKLDTSIISDIPFAYLDESVYHAFDKIVFDYASLNIKIQYVTLNSKKMITSVITEYGINVPVIPNTLYDSTIIIPIYPVKFYDIVANSLLYFFENEKITDFDRFKRDINTITRTIHDLKFSLSNTCSINLELASQLSSTVTSLVPRKEKYEIIKDLLKEFTGSFKDYIIGAVINEMINDTVYMEIIKGHVPKIIPQNTDQIVLYSNEDIIEYVTQNF
jgi:hypothetical protein